MDRVELQLLVNLHRRSNPPSIGNILIAAQAAYTADEYQRGGDPEEQAHAGFADHYVRSISRLKSIAAKEVHFSHDDNVVNSDSIGSINT